MLIPISLLLLGATPAPGAALHTAPAALTAPVRAETYEDLMEAYNKAKAERRAQIKAATSAKERRVLRAKRPAAEFLPRFEALGQAGDVRGFTWILKQAKYLGVKKADRVANKLDIYGRIVMAPADSEHFTAAIVSIGEDQKLEAGQRISLLKRVMGRKDAAGEGQCTAHLYAGSLLFDSEVDSDKAMGEQILKELVASESCSKQAKAAEQALLGVSIEVGGTAPDFEGTTIDGDKFNLYDYRGKVVLIDFFGFW